MSVSLTKKLFGEGTNGTDKLVVCVGLMVRAHTHETTDNDGSNYDGRTIGETHIPKMIGRPMRTHCKRPPWSRLPYSKYPSDARTPMDTMSVRISPLIALARRRAPLF
jgi:hypothetical protein